MDTRCAHRSRTQSGRPPPRNSDAHARQHPLTERNYPSRRRSKKADITTSGTGTHPEEGTASTTREQRDTGQTPTAASALNNQRTDTAATRPQAETAGPHDAPGRIHESEETASAWKEPVPCEGHGEQPTVYPDILRVNHHPTRITRDPRIRARASFRDAAQDIRTQGFQLPPGHTHEDFNTQQHHHGSTTAETLFMEPVLPTTYQPLPPPSSTVDWDPLRNRPDPAPQAPEEQSGTETDKPTAPEEQPMETVDQDAGHPVQPEESVNIQMSDLGGSDHSSSPVRHAAARHRRTSSPGRPQRHHRRDGTPPRGRQPRPPARLDSQHRFNEWMRHILAGTARPRPRDGPGPRP